MAPIAVKDEDQDYQVKFRKIISPYREQHSGPKTYSRQLEEEGTAAAPKATVKHVH